MADRPRPIEGIDFYRENGRLVFTTIYHLKRGWCCHCHCQHCPWKEGNTPPMRLDVILPGKKSSANDGEPDDAA